MFSFETLPFDAFRPSVHTRRPSAFIENASIWKRSLKMDPNKNAHISFHCGQLKTHRSKTRASAPKALNFSRSSHRRIRAEDHNVEKDFGYDLVEQAHGGTSLSFSSMCIWFNYVTSIIPFSVFDRFSVDSWKRYEDGSVHVDRWLCSRLYWKRILLKAH